MEKATKIKILERLDWLRNDRRTVFQEEINALIGEESIEKLADEIINLCRNKKGLTYVEAYAALETAFSKLKIDSNFMNLL